jgi:hypothetical protein
VIERSSVPQEVIVVPRDYRTRFEREKRVPYGQWKKEHYKDRGKAERKEQKKHDRGDEGRGKHGR